LHRFSSFIYSVHHRIVMSHGKLRKEREKKSMECRRKLADAQFLPFFSGKANSARTALVRALFVK